MMKENNFNINILIIGSTDLLEAQFIQQLKKIKIYQFIDILVLITNFWIRVI